MERWRAYTDHLVHGLTASGGSLAVVHSDRENTEELITALVGQIQGSDSLNLLTGLQVTTNYNYNQDHVIVCICTRKLRKPSHSPWTSL